jgi:hypothetical protein
MKLLAVLQTSAGVFTSSSDYNPAESTYRKYLNNIRNHGGPFTDEGYDMDDEGQPMSVARIDNHERMKIL